MRLHTAGRPQGFQRPIVARLVTGPVPLQDREHTALLLPHLSAANGDTVGYAAVLTPEPAQANACGVPLVHSIRDTDHLAAGHIVAIEPLSGFIRTIYRPESRHNTIFATERCNSNCLMCSQPPIDTDDTSALTDRNLKLIDLISTPPEYLCITGGEPTLLDERLLLILEKLRDAFPTTYVHMLTNGRRFAWPDFTTRFAEVRHPNLSVGIPLYADHAALHDYVVQAKDAFDQTILGLHQLARRGIEIEIRVVLQGLTIPRLKSLAEYICRNLTFVDHVAFMGLEHIGYAPRNMKELWIDPIDYAEELEASVAVLSRFGISARIYNLQLCLLRKSLWKFARQAISDWKNTYGEACDGCAAREQCGGFFQWNSKQHSRGIHRINAEEMPYPGLFTES